MANFDAIVIGAGIAGSSAAYELAATHRTCLIEAETRPGVHATGRSAALFAPSYGGSAVRALTRASAAHFCEPPAGFADYPLLTPRGCLYIAREDQRSRLHDMVDRIAVSGGKCAIITSAEALARVPQLRAAYVAQAAFDDHASDIDVDALHQGYLRGFRSQGGQLLTDSPLHDASYRRGGWMLHAGDQRLFAPILINAAGAWADRVATMCGVARIGLEPRLRTAAVVDAPAGSDPDAWPAVIDCDEQFYFKPDAGRILVSPADETLHEPGDAYPDELNVAVAIDRVQAALSIQVLRVRQSWAGLRTFAPDRVPVVGLDRDAHGFCWCAGQGGYGVQTAPAMGRVTAAIARGDSLPADVSAEGITEQDLSPDRLRVSGILEKELL